jgi:uncharacterized membrane protein
VRWTVPNLVKSFLSKRDLQAVADAIGDAEKRTSGEIRVAIRQKRARGERNLGVEQLARLEFARLGMQRTQDRTGVLIFILVHDREFFILADEHINQKVAINTWDHIAGQMSASFARKEYREGLVTAVRGVADHLVRHFPVSKGDRNELSNEVAIS